MLKIRPSNERGYAHHGWLESYHSFSFAEYYDPAHMGFSVLRVINEDVVAAGAGFGMHPHRDMEIITYMLAGELRHQDSMGNTAVIKAGDVQRMTAGTGVRHSEINASNEAPVHLLQIWLLPAQAGLPPSYEDRHFSLSQKLNQWCLLVSEDGRDSSLLIHQDVSVFASVMTQAHALDVSVKQGRKAYLQVARGELQVRNASLNDVGLSEINLKAGDALLLDNAMSLRLTAEQEAEVLLFDLPNH